MNESNLPPHRDPRVIDIPKFMPFFWLAVAVLSGIFVSNTINAHWSAWLVCASIGFVLWLLSVLLKKRRSDRLHLPFIWVLIIFFLAGMRYQIAQPLIDPTHSAYYNGRGLVEIVGVVTGPLETYDNHISLTVKVITLTPLSSDAYLTDPESVKGKLILQVPTGTDYHYGDKLTIRGKLQDPPDSGDFSYRDYLKRKNIYSLVSFAEVDTLERDTLDPLLSAIYRLKERSKVVLQDILPSPETELLTGILLGDDNGISDRLERAYQITGTAHIIAISGFNIALLAGLVTSYARRWLGVWNGTFAAILVLAIYTILVGAGASVVRAAVMGSVGIMGASIGRRGNGLNTLGLAVMGMCLVDPNLPWDVGFQLSCFATLGLVLYAGPMHARLQAFLTKHLGEETAVRLAGPISEYFIFTLAAQALTLPLIAWHFGEISWIFLIANPLILPVQPLLMILGGFALLGGLLASGLGQVLAWMVWPFAAYTNSIVAWLADLAPSTINFGHFQISWLWPYYLLFFSLTLTKTRKALVKKLTAPNLIVFVLGSAALLIWAALLQAPDGKLSISILPGSDNPVALVQTQGGKSVLINGSVDASALREEVGKTLPFYKQKLEVLVIPLCRKDDVRGLLGLETYFDIEQVIWTCDPEDIQTTRQLYQAFQEAEIVQTLVTDGAWLDLGNEAALTLLQSREDVSLMDLTWENFNAIIAFGDINAIEGNLKANSPVIILPGSSNLSKAAHYYNLSPQLTVLSVNPSSLPLDGQFPLADLFSSIPLLRTDQVGMIELKTDGRQLWTDPNLIH